MIQSENLIFDTHAHYDDSAFDEDRDELIGSLPSKGVFAAVDQGTTVESSEFAIKLAEKYDIIYAAVGIHPECISEKSPEEVGTIRKLASNPRVVAIGEIGLDYYYDTPRELQKEVFACQLMLANELGLPVNIHDREAHGDTMELLRKYRPRGILHCFSGSVEMAREAVRLGMYIGIGGVVTFKNSRKCVEVVNDIPIERIVLETDCPYLAPVPLRGKRNDSSLIIHTAGKIAELKSMTVEEVLRITRQNAAQVYNLQTII